MREYKPCGRPGHNTITHCIEPKDHEGPHTYGPYSTPDTKFSDQLEQVKSLLVRSCPDWVIGDIVTPRPKCCPFHHAAKVVGDVQTLLVEIHQ